VPGKETDVGIQFQVPADLSPENFSGYPPDRRLGQRHNRYGRFGERSPLHFVGSGPGSSVGIATGYGLDGPGIESRCGRDFSHTSRPALRPTQPPVQWVPGLSRG
jgi:hypothetical protein